MRANPSAADRLRIVVSGYLVRIPVGGLAWHYLQYVLGLEQLGHEVFYLEDSSCMPSCVDLSSTMSPAAGEPIAPSAFQNKGKDPSYGLRFAATALAGVGLPDRWAYFDGHESRWHGPLAQRALEVARTADIFLDVSGGAYPREWLQQIPVRVLVDTDPVFTQLRHKHLPACLETALGNNVFLSFGENIGRSTCRVPDDGLPWRRTRQPIVLDAWPSVPVTAPMRFTTVMSWSSYPPARDGLVQYGLKSHSFEEFRDLPAAACAELELSLDASPDVFDDLRSRGWRLRDGLETTRDPWVYRRYIQESSAEISIAKLAYVTTRSGWFSERSAAYLASGRPVLAQETGFSDWLETGTGVVPFDSPESAIEGMRQISMDYPRHSQRARQIASEYFDSRKVLSRLIEDCFGESLLPVDLSRLAGGAQLDRYRRALRRMEALRADDAPVVLIDDGQSGMFAGGRGGFLPFLEKDGAWWGQPSDDAVAIRELERLRSEGISLAVIAWPAMWWLEHYRGFRDHLCSSYRLLEKNGDLVVFDLRTPADPGQRNQAARPPLTSPAS